MTELSYAPAALRSDFEGRALRWQVSAPAYWRRRVGPRATGVWALSPTRALRGIAQFTDDAWSGGHYSFGNGGNVLNPHDASAAQARYLGELRTRLAKYASNEVELQDVVLAGLTRVRVQDVWRRKRRLHKPWTKKKHPN